MFKIFVGFVISKSLTFFKASKQVIWILITQIQILLSKRIIRGFLYIVVRMHHVNISSILFLFLFSFFQEYPPGLKLVPIGSKTAMPFRTTNLIIFAPENVSNESENNSFVAWGCIDSGSRMEVWIPWRGIISFAMLRRCCLFDRWFF